MQSAQDRFPEVFALVGKDHKDMQEGHDMHHVMRVAHFGRVIYRAEWQDDERGTRLAQLACLCHNADRVLEIRLGKDNVTSQAIEALVRQWLQPSDTAGDEKRIIVNAVLVHNGKNDSNHHSKVAMALRDADRVVNLELDLVIRSGQRFFNKPPVDYDIFFRQPPNFRNPQTVMEDLALSLEWVDPTNPFCVQTDTGMKLALERAKTLQWYFDTLKAQLKVYGFLADLS